MTRPWHPRRRRVLRLPLRAVLRRHAPPAAVPRGRVRRGHHRRRRPRGGLRRPGRQAGGHVRASAELSDADGKLRVEVGSRVSAVVDSVDGATGQVRLRAGGRAQRGGGRRRRRRRRRRRGAAGPSLVEGARVKGKVTGVERYGVFVQIAGTQGRSGRGLVPTPETGTPRGADLKKHFAVGQEVEAKILNIDEDGQDSPVHRGARRRRRARPLRGLQVEGASSRAPRQPRPRRAGRKEKPAPRGFGTLGRPPAQGRRRPPPPAEAREQPDPRQARAGPARARRSRRGRAPAASRPRRRSGAPSADVRRRSAYQPPAAGFGRAMSAGLAS